jgi:predicted Ser/Thr protein kinase
MTMRKRRYRIAELLGRGGFGSVYKAEKLGEEGFSTIVAIKLLHAMGGGSNPQIDKARSEAVRRLRDEARLLGLLKHRSIVQVYDLERLHGEWAIVMEYVDGIQLAELLELTRVPVRQALAIIEEVADALHTAYHFEPSGQKLHLLHRDIKPSNVMLTQGGSIKVLDFGIARANFEARESHTAGFLIGTQSYMSPEHLDFDDDTIQVGPESDIYALGAVLFELLAHQPFGRATLDPLMHQDKVSKKLDEHILGRVPHGLYQLLERMLSYAPGVRPTALELRTACEDLQHQLPGESLRAWCERVVAPLVRRRAKPAPGRDPIIGTVLEEGAMPEGAFLDAHDRTVARKPAPSTYDVGDTWGEAAPPGKQRARASAAASIDLGSERDPVASPLVIDSPIHQTLDDVSQVGVDIALDGEGDWEPRPGRKRTTPADQEAGSRRLVLLGGGLGVLAVVAAGVWVLTLLVDKLEDRPELVDDPPAAVADVEGAPAEQVEVATEPEAPSADVAPRTVEARHPVAAEPAPPVVQRPVPEPVVAESPSAAPEPEPEPEPVPPEPVVNTDARLAAIAALRGGGEAPVEDASDAPSEEPAVASVEEPVEEAPPAEPPPPPAPGSYTVQGNAIEVFLKSGGRRFEPGAEIDAGRYDIWALFDRSPGAAAIRVGVAHIQPGATVTIDCDAGMTLCRAL